MTKHILLFVCLLFFLSGCGDSSDNEPKRLEDRTKEELVLMRDQLQQEVDELQKRKIELEQAIQKLTQKVAEDESQVSKNFTEENNPQELKWWQKLRQKVGL